MNYQYRHSRKILIGAQCNGFDLATMARAMKVSTPELFALSAGTKRLTHAQALALEKLTGVSSAELALRGVQATGDPARVLRDQALFQSTGAMFAAMRTGSGRRRRAASRKRQTA